MDRDIQKRNWHELRVLATNGRVFRLRVADVTRLFRSRLFLFSIALFTSLIALNDQFLFDQPIPLMFRLVFWYVQALLTAILWLGLFVAASRVSRHFGRDVTVPSAVLIVITVALLVVLNYSAANVLLGEPDFWTRPVVSDIIRYALIAVVFETMVAAFLLPAILDGDGSTKPGRRAPAIDRVDTDSGPVSDGENRFRLRGQVIDLSNLLYMKSAENYVELVTTQGTSLVRASLREIELLCPDGRGIRPHRSFWVQRDSIAGLKRAEGFQFLVLRDGTEIPVARGRRPAVSKWLSAQFGRQRRTRAKKGPG